MFRRRAAGLMSGPTLYSVLLLVLVGIIMVGFVLFEGRHARSIQRDPSRSQPQPGRRANGRPVDGPPPVHRDEERP